MKQTTGIVRYDGRTIEYIRFYKKVKNVNLRIRKDASVAVSANRLVSQKQVEDFVRKNAEFILRAQAKMRERTLSENNRSYENGEELLFLGKRYLLKVVLSKEEGVVLQENVLLLKTKENDVSYKAKIMQEFRRREGLKVFSELTKKYYPFFCQYTSYPDIVVKNVTSMWGCCTPKKRRITYAEKLVERPIPAIEYVVVHELSHFVYQNHSKAFYAVVENVLPQWKTYKKLLYLSV